MKNPRQVVMSQNQFDELMRTKEATDTKSIWESGDIWFYSDGFSTYEILISKPIIGEENGCN